jgi:recombination protein RecA
VTKKTKNGKDSKEPEAPSEDVEVVEEEEPAKKLTKNPAAKNTRAFIAKSVVAFISKATNQKPLGFYGGTFPHNPSGIVAVDNLIGGDLAADKKSMVCPGFPKARITEIFGAESSGKTTLAIKAAVTTQKEGGVVMYLDFEHALHHGYAKACGLDFDPEKLLLYSPHTLEEGMKMAYVGIRQGVQMVIVDSVAAMVPQSELEKKIDDPARIGALARAMSDILAKMIQWLDGQETCLVFINQTRSLIAKNSHAGPDDNSAGGKALKFYSTIRLKLTRIKSEYIEKKDPHTLKKKRVPYGNLVNVKCVKNRLAGKQGHTCEIFIRYGLGVDEFMSLIEGAVPRRIVEKSGSDYKYGGKSFRGREQFRKALSQDAKMAEEIRVKLVKSLLSEAPEPLLDDDEIDDDDILSDLNREFGDDDLAESFDDGARETEEVVDAEDA